MLGFLLWYVQLKWVMAISNSSCGYSIWECWNMWRMLSYSYFLPKWRIYFVGMAVNDEGNYCRNPALLCLRVLTWVKFRVIEDFKGQGKQWLDSIKMSSLFLPLLLDLATLWEPEHIFMTHRRLTLNWYVLLTFKTGCGKLIFSILKRNI